MLAQHQSRLLVPTRGRGFYDITAQVREWLQTTHVLSGLVTIHLHHTSASLLIQENADPEVRRDLERFFARLVPDGDRLFQHVCEGEDDMPAHVRTALTTVNVSLPVTHGELALGTWQGLYLWEHRIAPHRRELTLHLIGQ